jgi:phosphoglycolate phosphatase-like HAD superfamily hydrolase
MEVQVGKICVLFDLDGTLVLTGGAGMIAFDATFEEIFRVPGKIKDARPAGKTDPVILNQVCQKVLRRDPTSEEVEAYFKRYLTHLKEIVHTTDKYQVLPGIQALLEVLRDHPDCLLGLGTGNIREGARVKLSRPPGLWDYFAFGGFGSDSTDRPELLAIGRDRGKALLPAGEDFEEVYIIGDTPRDIEAGQAIQARTVGVATGPFSATDLQAAGADRVYEDFSDYPSFIKEIGLT